MLAHFAKPTGCWHPPRHGRMLNQSSLDVVSPCSITFLVVIAVFIAIASVVVAVSVCL